MQHFLAFFMVVLPFGVFVATAQEIPIYGTTSKVLLSLTDHVTANEVDFVARPRPTLVGDPLPAAESTSLAIAVLDTAMVTVVISSNDTERFDIEGAGFGGFDTTPVASEGTLSGHNSDPMGVFVAGLPEMLSEELFLPPDMRGIVNSPVLYFKEEQRLTSIGTPVLGFYTTVLRNSDERIIAMDDTLFQSPAVELLPLGSVARPDRNIPIRYTPGALGRTSFIPNLRRSLNVGGDLRDNPATPIIGGFFFASTTIEHQGNQQTGEFLISTGSEASFISTEMASKLGIDPVLDKAFEGTIDRYFEDAPAPGLKVDRVLLGNEATGVVLDNPPIFVFDADDPQDGVGLLDGVLGMNLFQEFDLIINPEPENTYLGILSLGEPIARVCVESDGDLNRDGEVTFNDFLILSNQFGQNGIHLESDLDCDGSVTFSDFLILAANFPRDLKPKGSESVPEPIALGWLALAAFVLIARRCREEPIHPSSAST